MDMHTELIQILRVEREVPGSHLFRAPRSVLRASSVLRTSIASVFGFRTSLSPRSGLRASLSHSGGFYRGHRHGEEFMCLFHQFHQTFFCHQFQIDQQFHPVKALIAVFFNNAHFCDEIRIGPRSSRSPVIRADRSATAKQLFPDHIGRLTPRKGFTQADDPHGKHTSPFFQILHSIAV